MYGWICEWGEGKGGVSIWIEYNILCEAQKLNADVYIGHKKRKNKRKHFADYHRNLPCIIKGLIGIYCRCTKVGVLSIIVRCLR